jgi:hypothetical protein
MSAYPSGFQPYRNSHFQYDEWEEAGYDRAYIEDYLGSNADSYNHPNAAIEPRIPGIFQYYSVAEDELAKGYAGQYGSAQETADAIAAAWEGSPTRSAARARSRSTRRRWGCDGTTLAIITIAIVAKVLWAMRWPGVRPSDAAITTLAVLTFAWAILPPVWFWLEHWFLYTAHGDVAAFAQFRHNQQLSAAIWAGLLASSAVVLGRAQARERHEPKPAVEGWPVYAVFGSFQQDPIASSGPSALIWTGEAEPGTETINDLKAKSPFPFLHVVQRLGDDEESQTVVHTFKLGLTS